MNLSSNGSNFMVVWFLTTIFLNCTIANLCSNKHFVSSITYCSSTSGSSILSSSLKKLKPVGAHTREENIDERPPEDIDEAAKDFGNMTYNPPLQVVYPNSVSEISDTVKRIFDAGAKTNLTIAARGRGHSVQGQAAASEGVVVIMRSLQRVMNFSTAGDYHYVDVSGGELWINVLKESVKHGLSPKSWTDYLNLTVGGTLSNAGISGQTFRHGPQIDNVYELEVVTGKGEVTTCSGNQNADLFYGVLGGLGQFGIVTRARISLQPAPLTVKWIRVLYSDFSNFIKDQEHLISSEDTFDYIEGFVLLNGTDFPADPSFNPKVRHEANQFKPDGKFLFVLEVVKHYNPGEIDVDQKIERLLSELSYTKTITKENASYVDFLDRLHKTEMELREKGLWEVPHPWLNLLIPKSRIHDFANQVFGNILTDTNNGPLLIYPVNKSKWDNRTSVAIPDEDVFYQVALLSSAVPASSLEHILALNKRILDFCRTAGIGFKVYVPHYTTQEEWQAHFGSKWGDFVRRKSIYDPLAILAPGQKIFPKGEVFSNT